MKSLVFLAVLVGCSPLKTDPHCAAHEAEFRDRMAHPKPPTVSIAGEWGHPRGGASCVYKLRGNRVTADCGDLVPDGRGGMRYDVMGHQSGVLDGSTLFLHLERGGLQVLEVSGNQMHGTSYLQCKTAKFTRQRIR